MEVGAETRLAGEAGITHTHNRASPLESPLRYDFFHRNAYGRIAAANRPRPPQCKRGALIFK